MSDEITPIKREKAFCFHAGYVFTSYEELYAHLEAEIEEQRDKYNTWTDKYQPGDPMTQRQGRHVALCQCHPRSQPGGRHAAGVHPDVAAQDACPDSHRVGTAAAQCPRFLIGADTKQEPAGLGSAQQVAAPEKAVASEHAARLCAAQRPHGCGELLGKRVVVGHGSEYSIARTVERAPDRPAVQGDEGQSCDCDVIRSNQHPLQAASC